MDSHLAAAAEFVGRRMNAQVQAHAPVTGGDINSAWRLSLTNKERGRFDVFVKTNASAPATMFDAEARGLAFLAEAAALRTPQVLGVGDGFLALEWIQSRTASPDFDERLGQGLARLHRASGPAFGLDHGNFVGRLPQNNAAVAANTWAAFYTERRLLPQSEAAAKAGRLPNSYTARIEALCARLPELVGPCEPPARLHGDLWAGNHVVDEQGQPILIDPAVYLGHREVDLAMMRLFGGYGARVFDAYSEAFPLAPGHAKRVPLYQLYYLLVHVNLFGGSYVTGVGSALRSLGF